MNQNNDVYLNILKTQNPEFGELKLINEVLCLGDQNTIIGIPFSLEKIVNQNEFLAKEISELSAKMFFNIVLINQKATKLFDPKDMDEQTTSMNNNHFDSAYPTNYESDQIDTSTDESLEPKVEAIPIHIGVNQYFYLLQIGDPTPEEMDMILDFDIFISDLITYSEYLSPELNYVLDEFRNMMEKYEVYKENLNQLQINSLKKYYEHLGLKELYLEKKNAQSKIRVLRKEAPKQAEADESFFQKESAGYIDSILAVGFMSLLGVIIASIFYIIAR